MASDWTVGQGKFAPWADGAGHEGTGAASRHCPITENTNHVDLRVIMQILGSHRRPRLSGTAVTSSGNGGLTKR